MITFSVIMIEHVFNVKHKSMFFSKSVRFWDMESCLMLSYYMKKTLKDNGCNTTSRLIVLSIAYNKLFHYLNYDMFIRSCTEWRGVWRKNNMLLSRPWPRVFCKDPALASAGNAMPAQQCLVYSVLEKYFRSIEEEL